MSEPVLIDRWKNCSTIDWAKAEKDRRLMGGILTSGSIDSDGEVLEPVSAFHGTVEWIARGGTPLAWMHDLGGSLGHAFEAEGLRRTGDAKVPWAPTTNDKEIEATKIRAELGRDYGFGTMLHGRVEVNDVWQMLVQKAVSALSIHVRGYEAGEHETGAPLIVTQRVIEGSIVTVPAQREAVAGVERMLKAFGIHRDCKSCTTTIHKGLERLGHMAPDQWRYVVEHCREHGQDEKPEDLSELARGLVDLAAALKG